ncbi:hypothetical protein MNBD_GAMMA19-530 [hydrothermal vent metagenome]|uniref:Sulfotransferase n=1 Tax=hydrothermal vent metagenome TaxID=652676 RepID=A0A3B1AIS7_9ZZZZ
MADKLDLKHRWSIGHNHMSGITAGKWWQLLRDVNFDVDAVYAHRVAFISLLSLNNSLWAAIEKMRYQKKIDQVERVHPPVFVLGHWRSGTTHLHNLFCQDVEQFAYPNTYQAINPYTFLSTENINTRLFGWLLPKTRPMDNMAMSFSEPQEDELGLSMVCLRSLYFGITFPRLEKHFSQYLTFDNAEPQAREDFKQALAWFVRKLTLKYDKPIVIKSPSHTARIKLLLELYPDARFVHIHRNPYEVFLSSQKYHDTATWYTYLQRPDRNFLDDEILRRYVMLFDGFFAGRDLIPDGQFHEMSFRELEAAPLETMRNTYNALGLSGFSKAEPRLKKYISSLKNYKKNDHPELSAHFRQRVAENWGRSFDTWGYER